MRYEISIIEVNEVNIKINKEKLAGMLQDPKWQDVVGYFESVFDFEEMIKPDAKSSFIEHLREKYYDTDEVLDSKLTVFLTEILEDGKVEFHLLGESGEHYYLRIEAGKPPKRGVYKLVKDEPYATYSVNEEGEVLETDLDTNETYKLKDF